MGASLLNLRQLLRDLWSQKLRTLMTIFGIVWGTVAITLLLGFGRGMHAQLAKSFAGLGENIVICWPSRTSLAWEGIGKGRTIRLQQEDVEFLRAQAQTLGQISGEYQRDMLFHYGETAARIDTSGVAPEFADMRNLIPQEGGRFLNALDWEQRRRVLFIGDKLAQEVFGSANPVGQVVSLNGSPFLVVGVLKKKTQDSSYSGRDEGKIFIPGTTFAALTGWKNLDNVIVRPKPEFSSEPLKKEVIELLGKRHRFAPDDKEAVQMWDVTDNMKFLNTFMGGFRIFLGIIGLLTLVVGGIGVSNIMNVVVEERTREIGIKLALGARPRAVLAQFLIETMIVTGLGGLIGYGIAAGVCLAFPAGLESYVGRPSVGGAIGLGAAAIIGLVGLIAGWFPARSAARLDPVVAMKA